MENEPQLVTPHAEFLEKNFNLQVVAYAATLTDGNQSKVNAHQPRLILLDNFLPDALALSIRGGSCGGRRGGTRRY